jgi:hypothetical protein
MLPTARATYQQRSDLINLAVEIEQPRAFTGFVAGISIDVDA